MGAVSAGCLGRLPLRVVSRGNRSHGPKQQQFVPDQALWHAQQEVWQRLQSQLARASTNSRQIPALQSDHYVQFNEPELVASVVRDLWSELNL